MLTFRIPSSTATAGNTAPHRNKIFMGRSVFFFQGCKNVLILRYLILRQPMAVPNCTSHTTLGKLCGYSSLQSVISTMGPRHHSRSGLQGRKINSFYKLIANIDRKLISLCRTQRVTRLRHKPNPMPSQHLILNAAGHLSLE